VLTELKNRGVQDVCITVCDGLTGLPDAISATWPQAVTQTCIVHLLRNSLRSASRKDWAAIAKDLKPVSSAATEPAPHDRLAEFADRWEARYPAIIKLWESAWAEFVPFLNFDPEIRGIIATTNAIESLNARFAPRGPRPRPLPNRAGRAEMPVPDRAQPGPDRPRPPALEQQVEGRPQRVRQHLRRPRQQGKEVARSTPVTPLP
jgi:putative transposase